MTNEATVCGTALAVNCQTKFIQRRPKFRVQDFFKVGLLFIQMHLLFLSRVLLLHNHFKLNFKSQKWILKFFGKWEQSSYQILMSTSQSNSMAILLAEYTAIPDYFYMGCYTDNIIMLMKLYFKTQSLIKIL